MKNDILSPVSFGFLDFSQTPVTTSAYVTLPISVPKDVTYIDVFSSADNIFVFAIGEIGSEIDQFLVAPGGPGVIRFAIEKGRRLSLKAMDSTASTGNFVINLFNS